MPALALVLRLAPGPHPVDDAYITFRYARNLAEGLGLVYNAGEPVLGTSSPAFALLLALTAMLTGLEPPLLALGIGAIADAATTLLMLHLGAAVGLSRPHAALTALAFAFYPLSIRYAIGGMETPVVTALGVGCLLLWLRGRDSTAAATAGAAMLTRPDALALAAVTLTATAVRARRLPLRQLAVLAGALLPWSIFAATRYGTPVPQSLEAKSQAVYLGATADGALQVLYYLAGMLLAGPADLAARGLTVWRAPDERAGPIVAAILVGALFAIGSVAAVKRDRHAAVVFAVPILFCAAYGVLGLRGGIIAEWYLVPLAPLLLVGMAAGIAGLAAALPRSGREAILLTSGIALAGAQAWGLDWSRLDRGQSPLPRAVWTEREEMYRAAARFLEPRLRDGDVVAAPEIGALGYHCRCRILDTVGLVSPEAMGYYPLPARMYVVNSAVPPGLIRDARPDWIVTLDVFIARSLLPEPWFEREYAAAAMTPTRVFGSRALVVFERRDRR